MKSGICARNSRGDGGDADVDDQMVFMLGADIVEHPLILAGEVEVCTILQSNTERSDDAKRDDALKQVAAGAVAATPEVVQRKYTEANQTHVLEQMLKAAANAKSETRSENGIDRMAAAMRILCLLTDPTLVNETVAPSVDPTVVGLSAVLRPGVAATDAPPPPPLLSPPSELQLALQADDAETIQVVLARRTPTEGNVSVFVPIKDRGGGVALQSAMPPGWTIATLEPAYWRKLFAIAQGYFQEQIEKVRSPEAHTLLHAAKNQLDADKEAYDAAFESVGRDANFETFESTLSDLAGRVRTRCRDDYGGSTKPEQRSSNLVEVYRDAESVEHKFATLLAELYKQLPQCVCSVAPAKRVFRCIEKMALDPARQWDAKILTDMVRGTAAIVDMAIGLQLVELLMACDLDEVGTSRYKRGGSIIMTTIADSIAIVGVKNRWSDAGASGCGGWRDAQIKFFFKSDPNKHVCELQVSHTLLANVRKGMGLHHVYASARNALELLEAVGASAE